MQHRRLLLLTLLALPACAPSLPTLAERAFQERRFVAGVELYEKAAENDEGIRAQLVALKQRALAGLIADAAQSRMQGEEERAVSVLVLTHDKQRDWAAPIPKASQAQYDRLASWAVQRAAAETRSVLASKGPLAAEEELARPEWNLYTGEQTENTVMAAIADVGQSRCETLRKKRTGPMLRHLVVQYCAHFGIKLPPAPTPTMKSHALAVQGVVEGLDAHEVELLYDTLDRVWRDTPWYDANAKRTERAEVGGRLQVSRSTHRRHRTHSYTVSIPYDDIEYYTEWVDESYLDNETYTDYETHTDWQSESYDCGTFDSPRTCTRSVPVTRSEPVTRTRLVTKYRSVPESRTRTVTRYRSEGRTYRYPVEMEKAKYAAALSVTMRSPEVSATFETQRTEKDDTHNESAHGLVPHRAQLTSDEEWRESGGAALAKRFRDEAKKRWAEEFCSREDYSPRQAARCLVGVETPPAAKDALESYFGDPVTQLRKLSATPQPRTTLTPPSLDSPEPGRYIAPPNSAP